MKKIALFLACVLATLLTGCASNLMTTAETTETPSLPKHASTITFFRTSSFGGATQAPVAQATKDGDIRLVGISSTGTKIRHVVAPGEYMFVVGGESASLVKATIAPNKHYYIRIEPRIGFFKSRFRAIRITPEELTTETVQNQLQSCRVVVPNEDAKQWFNKNKQSMKEKLIAAQENFNNSPKIILLESHGVDTLY